MAINIDYSGYEETHQTIKQVKKLVKKIAENPIPKKYEEDIINLIYECMDCDEEYQVKCLKQLRLLAYLDWGSPTPDVNFKKTQSILETDHACLEEPKDKILDYIAVLKHKVDQGAKPSPILFVGPPGIGKCHGKGTEILMYDGSVKKVEEIVPYDQVMGDDSTPRNIKSIYVGKGPLYRIIPNKNGKPYVVNENHILSLKSSTTDWGLSVGEVLDIPLVEFLQLPKSKQEKLKSYCVPVEFKEKSLEIDPYYLGLWLGDGTRKQTAITNMDTEIIEFIDRMSKKLDMKQTITNKESKAVTLRIVNKKRHGKNKLLEMFRSNGLYNEKYIPFRYLTSSTEQRLGLLAGFLDADGHLINKCFEITQKNKTLANQIYYLAKSLGFCVTKRMKKVNKYGWYHRIFISGDTDKIPTLINRKHPEPRKQVKNPLVSGFKIEPVGVGDYYGFETDGNHRYCLGDFQVTHNSSFAKSIAKALNRPMERVFLGGVNDPHHIYGFKKTYIGASNGNIIEAIRKAKSRHCVVLLDEIDKIPENSEGFAVSNAMMMILDRTQNHEFTDHFLETPFDLSDTLFIATANSYDNIHPAILDRCEIVELSSYTEDEKFKIARKHLIPKIKKEFILNSAQFSITDRAIIHLIRFYTREAGVRKLDYLLKSLAKKMLRYKADRKSTKIKEIKTPDLRLLLGPEYFTVDPHKKDLPPGIVCGLSASSLGGSVDYCEVILTLRQWNDRSKQEIKVSGLCGQMMIESADIVVDYMTNKYCPNLKDWDIHVNWPGCYEGQDGPSGGTAFFIALYSYLSHTPVDSKITMTGEVNLRGGVTGVGGIKEKIIATYKEGKKKVIIPKENIPDLDKIPKKIRNALEIVGVDNVTDLLKEAGMTQPIPQPKPIPQYHVEVNQDAQNTLDLSQPIKLEEKTP